MNASHSAAIVLCATSPVHVANQHEQEKHAVVPGFFLTSPQRTVVESNCPRAREDIVTLVHDEERFQTTKLIWIDSRHERGTAAVCQEGLNDLSAMDSPKMLVG